MFPVIFGILFALFTSSLSLAESCSNAFSKLSGDPKVSSDLLASDLEHLEKTYFASISSPNAEQLKAARNKKIDPVELKAIHFYVSNQGFGLINAQLRKEYPANYAAMPRRDAQMIAKLMVSGLSKLDKHTGIVTRGVTLPKKVLKHHTPGTLIRYRGFMSASSLKNGADNFQKFHTLRMTSKTGRALRRLSTIPEEKEILFIPDTVFRILSVQKIGPGLEIKMEEVVDEIPATGVIDL